jgi:hypothetical protein
MTAIEPNSIEQAVTRAIETAKDHSGGSRLLPFTTAEIRFIQEVLTCSLTELLLENQKTK